MPVISQVTLNTPDGEWWEKPFTHVTPELEKTDKPKLGASL